MSHFIVPSTLLQPYNLSENARNKLKIAKEKHKIGSLWVLLLRLKLAGKRAQGPTSFSTLFFL